NVAALVVEIVGALGVGVVGAAVDGEIATVVDVDLVLIKVLVFSQVGPAIEFNPGRILRPTIADDEVPYARKVALPGKLILAGKSRSLRRNFRIVPEKLKHGQRPLLREKTALAEE